MSLCVHASASTEYVVLERRVTNLERQTPTMGGQQAHSCDRIVIHYITNLQTRGGTGETARKLQSMGCTSKAKQYYKKLTIKSGTIGLRIKHVFRETLFFK